VVLALPTWVVPPGHPARRLAIAVLSSLGGLIFGVGIATGQLAIAIAAWAIGGLTCLILVLDDKPPGPGPANVRDNDPR